jgi:DNA processing protein
MGKDIYVLSHRIGESKGTNKLVQEGKAKVITDIDAFVYYLYPDARQTQGTGCDEFIEFCKSNPSYEDALAKFPSRVFEAELAGEVLIKDAKVYVT